MAETATIESILETIALPTCVGSWADDETVEDKHPYIEYHRLEADDIGGDDVVKVKRNVWELSVYGKTKDSFDFWDACDTVTDTLDALKVFYDRSGDIFFDDCMYQTITFTLPA